MIEDVVTSLRVRYYLREYKVCVDFNTPSLCSVAGSDSDVRSKCSDSSSGLGRSEKSFSARYSSSIDGRKGSRNWRPV